MLCRAVPLIINKKEKFFKNFKFISNKGEKALGRLGLGKDGDKKQVHFTEIKELCEVGVTFITTKKKHCAAITSAG